MRKLITLLAAFTLAFGTSAQEVQKCCNSTNSSFLLGSANYARHNQSLYLPSDFNNAISGNITHLYYRYGTANAEQGNVLTDLTISMAHTTQTSFINDAFITQGFVPVLASAEYTIPPGIPDEWFVIELDQPFAYDATLNLVVDIRFDQSQTLLTCRAVGTPGRKIATGDPLSLVGTTTSDNLHDIGFDLDGATGISSSGPIYFTSHPNPANDRFQVTFGQAITAPIEVQVMDATGRSVGGGKLPAGSDRLLLDVSAYAPGLYTIGSADRSINVRFVRE